MSASKWIQDLVLLSNKWGAKPNHIQGAGGNFSLKEGQRLWIKASGFFLTEVSEKEGIASVDLDKMRSGLEDLFAKNLEPSKQEEALTRLTGEAARLFQNSIPRPSMETAFHTLFQEKVVMHTHAVSAMVLACRKNAAILAEKILPHSPVSAVFVGYGNPGFGLYEKLRSITEKLSPAPKVFVLESHGLLVTGDSVSEAEKNYEAFTTYLEELLELPPFPSFELTPFEGNWVLNGDSLFQILLPHLLKLNGENSICPDQSIILKGKESKYGINEKGQFLIKAKEKEAKAIADVLIASAYVLHIFEKQWVEPQYLNLEALNLLHGMSSEQFRKTQISS